MDGKYLGSVPHAGVEVRPVTGRELLTRLSNHYLSRPPTALTGPSGTRNARETHRVGSALSCAGGRILAARASDDEWRQALERATPQGRALVVSISGQLVSLRECVRSSRTTPMCWLPR